MTSPKLVASSIPGTDCNSSLIKPKAFSSLSPPMVLKNPFSEVEAGSISYIFNEMHSDLFLQGRTDLKIL
jgi:hypothetical protein